MNLWNETLDALKPYTVASHKIWEVEPERRGQMLKLDWNEAAVPPSPLVRQSLQALLQQEDFFHLYPATFNEELMQCLSDYTKLPPENIQYFGGSDDLHEYLVRAYLKEGDRVLILWPSYDNFRLTAESTGARLFYGELGEDFAFDEEAFRRRIETVRPRLVYLCNPNNPSGTLVPVSTIAAFLDDYPEICFLVDEAYGEFAGESAGELVLSRDNLLITRTLSKAFALANLRFGYLLASRGNIEAVSKIRNPKNINTFTQAAAISALKDAAYMRAYVREVQEARDWFIEEIRKGPLSTYLKAFPSQGNFVLLRCSAPEVKMVLARQWEEKQIFVRDVRQSETLENCLRVTIGRKSQMERVIEAALLAFPIQ
ncbi:MAG: histidinol-phosphate aminotransferase family protein [Lachnospiraceae bacterium]|nr:histidinol-phosphate aminotransferase family protein [Lachnospiraceae bacterium]